MFVSGCSAVGSAPLWGSGGRKFKSCHSDQTRPILWVGLFLFAPAPSLDVCFAHQALFAIRRADTTNHAMLHSDQTRPILWVGLFCLLRRQALTCASHTKPCLLFVGRTRRITQCCTQTKQDQSFGLVLFVCSGAKP